MKLAVSILSVKNDYKNWIKKLNETNITKLHLDIMDSTFTPSSSFSIKEAYEISELSKKDLDVHIMSTNLDNILDDYIKLNPETINIHYEASNNIEKYINKIKKNNIKVGIAINPETNISEIYSYLDKIDQVLIMSVNPGKGGQEFKEETIEKLKLLNNLKSNYKFIVEVDGGINNNTIKKVTDLVDIVVSGSYITKDNNYEEKINDILLQK
ncbi:MAG: ribulose-phosphate 3-epimerase [Bacilli bacterium]|nr:ribulose-phosphate 3-epimerase [Bacilli bacterium]